MTGRILFAQFSSSRDGSTLSGLQVANGLRAAGWRTRVAFGHSGPMEQVYRDQGHETTVIPHKNWLRRDGLLHGLKDWFQEVRNSAAFENDIDLFQPQVVYVNTAVSLAAARAARRRGLPLIWHLRELFDDVGGELRCSPVVRPQARRVFGALATRLITNSEAVRDNLLRKVDRARATIIPNAVEDTYFEPPPDLETARNELGLPAQGKIIGLPGTLRPMKGHEFFLQAVAPVLKEASDRLLAITGKGDAPLEARLREIAREQGIEQQVRFLGSLPGLCTFFAACDLISIPSRSEPFGRVAIEAMAVGKPVIASRVGGLIEVIEDGETGRLVDYGDFESWRRVLREILQDSTLADSLGSAGRFAAKSRHTEERLRRDILSVVDGTLKEPSQHQ